MSLDILLLILQIVLTLGLGWIIYKKNAPAQNGQHEELIRLMNRLEIIFREEARLSREEQQQNSRQAREELANQFRQQSLDQIQKLDKIIETLEQRLKEMQVQSSEYQEQMRQALRKSMTDYTEQFDRHWQSFNEAQRDKFSQMDQQQLRLIETTEKRLDTMREMVEEKLQKTLNERLGQSFETVGNQLKAVQEGLGEMRNLAQDVGGLKKVLSNVKQRGGLGEIQLAMLLEQMLAPEQYEANVKTKAGSSELVEFAIRMPGQDDQQKNVLLPIDAKFPKDAYEQLVDAYESADPAQVEAASKNLEAVMKKMAKDIRDKYLDPPHTTDFGIMFLPFEGIYAEVVRRSALLEQLQREYKVVVAGPSTLFGFLHSLQVGFRTLALQKRSSEVWAILGAVKTEFEKFGGMLEKAQKNIQTGLGQLDEVVGTRTRAIQRQLRNVESLPVTEAKKLLPDVGMEEEENI